MTEKCFLSIIVPTYNSENYIRRCIMSIVDVLRKGIELIVVDDGSTDKTLTICSKMSDIYPRIKVLSKSNGGVSSARNYGLSIANGEYVTFVDSDDWIRPDQLEAIIKELSDYHYDVISYNMIGVKDGIQRKVPFKDKGISDNFIYYRTYMNSVCNKIFLKSIIDEKGIRFNENISVCEDLLFTFNCLLNAKKIKYSDRNVYYYRYNINSATHNDHQYLFAKDEKIVTKEILKILRERNSIQKYRRFLIHRRLQEAIYYLIDPKLFSTEKYRKINKSTSEWINKKEVVHCILCFCANRNIDIVPYLYVKMFKK